ncbi:MAG TPA: peptidylprolyl isomerase [Polyangiaceae bacterium]
MSDELQKKVFSVPPPPTDEIDSDWGGKAADEKPVETATQAADEGVAAAKDSGPPGADAQLKAELKGKAETAAAPSTPPPSPASHDDEEDEEEEEEEDEEDEDDEEAPAARARATHRPVSRTAAPDAGDDWLPDWAPFAVLAALVILGVAGGLGAFTKPPAEGASLAPSTALAESTKPTSIAASHFLVMYKGSMRAPETVTRTKDEAKARALEGLAKVKKGEDFAKVVGEYSDEPGAAQRGGALGDFTADRMVKPFSDAAFNLKVGQISGLVETPFGFHVIKRTK